jgi:signal transduction histidine kinase
MTMRATRSGVSDGYEDRYGRRMHRMSYAQRAELRKRYNASIPRWRQPLVGYIATIPLVIAAIYATLSLKEMLGDVYFAGAIVLLTTMLIAIVWGVGPSLLCVLLSTLLLEYYFFPPLGPASLSNWHSFIQLIPLVISGLAIALITAQRERARLKTLAAEQELQSYALELETINAKLQDANQAKDRFLSIASHELKTPITTIRGQAQLALRRLARQNDLPSDREGVQQALEKINEQTTRLTSLIDELLDVSSMRAGKVELQTRRYDLRDICKEVVGDQRFLTGRTINLEMPAEPVEANVDYDRLSQVLVNLISNAVKYSPERESVEVSLCQGENSALIKVRDYGKGIPREQQERIFESFYRTPDAQSSSKKGMGLGLAISKEIVERHRGRLWCESSPGNGSTFIAEIPLR